MKPSPCLHPIQIIDPHGVKRLVPCGKCAACVVNKGRARTERLEDAISHYPFKFFVTLTYNDLNLPIAEYDPDTCSFIHPNDCDYNGEVYSALIDETGWQESDYKFMVDTLKKYNGLPVLSHRDIINFKKRFRYYFKKVFPNAKLFIYNCGEYGETFYRPHNHLLFGTDEACTTSVFESCVRKAWSVRYKVEERDILEPIGRIDCQRVTGKGVCGYVAQYLNSVTSLPRIYQSTKFRPFASSSSNGDGVLLGISQSDVREVFANPTLYVTRVRKGLAVRCPVPSLYVRRYFPVVPKFGFLARYELATLYELYNYYPQRELAFLRFNAPKRVPLSPLTGRNLPFDKMRNFIEVPDTLLHRLVGFTAFMDAKLHYIDDFHLRKRNFERLWYISRRVCLNAKLVGVTVSQYVDKIIDYHKNFELDKLKRFYELQQSLLDDPVRPVPLSHLFTLYYNTDGEIKNMSYYQHQFGARSDITLNSLEIQRAYAFQQKGILLDTTKTKKRNDYFTSHGLKRTPYVPLMNRKITTFLNVLNR